MKRKFTIILFMMFCAFKINAQTSCTGNLIQGTSFESSTDMTYWTLASNEPGGSLFSATSGYQICDAQYGWIRATDPSHNPAYLVTVYQNASATPGKTYTMTVYAGTHDPAQDQKLYLQFYNASMTLLSGAQSVQVDNNIDVSPFKLSLYTLSGVAPAGSVYVRVMASTQGIYTSLNTALKFDCFCLTASTTVLPVTGLSLSATPAANCGVNLAWQTLSEINTKSFEIEASADNINFQTIATVSAKGNSNTVSNYNFLQNATTAGIKYYRIKANDNVDGNYSYSNIVQMATNCNGKNILAVYPNPAKNVVTVGGAENGAKIQLLDLSGRVLSQQNANGTNADKINVENFLSGTYLIRVVTLEGTSTVVKLNKQ